MAKKCKKIIPVRTQRIEIQLGRSSISGTLEEDDQEFGEMLKKWFCTKIDRIFETAKEDEIVDEDDEDGDIN